MRIRHEAIDKLPIERKTALLLLVKGVSNAVAKRILAHLTAPNYRTVHSVGYLGMKKEDIGSLSDLPRYIRTQVAQLLGFDYHEASKNNAFIQQSNSAKASSNTDSLVQEARVAGISPELLRIARVNAENPSFLGSGGEKQKKKGRRIGK